MVAIPNLMKGLGLAFVNGLLAFKPLANFAKSKARQMMIERASVIGYSWQGMVDELRSQDLEAAKAKIENPNLVYPAYYLQPFHAYDEGNLGWDAATEVEVAAYAVHSKVWGETNAKGDALLRQSYHRVLQAQVSQSSPPVPLNILDIGCSVGMSTLGLAEIYPNATITGLDLSPYFLAIADLKTSQTSSQREHQNIHFIHAPAESTGLPTQSFDLISIFLVCHELPHSATIEILTEAKRLLRSGGCLAIMDMNPKSEIYAKMPPYIFTLLKSTEPYLDQYFSLDLEGAIASLGFANISSTSNSPRHRTVTAISQ
jgi:ubiquinone/menaquinone biosynthesis C-methylase UbiE